MVTKLSPRKFNFIIIPPNNDKSEVGLQDINDDKPFIVQRSEKPKSAIQREKERLEKRYGGEVKAHGITPDGDEF